LFLFKEKKWRAKSHQHKKTAKIMLSMMMMVMMMMMQFSIVYSNSSIVQLCGPSTSAESSSSWWARVDKALRCVADEVLRVREINENNVFQFIQQPNNTLSALARQVAHRLGQLVHSSGQVVERLNQTIAATFVTRTSCRWLNHTALDSVRRAQLSAAASVSSVVVSGAPTLSEICATETTEMHDAFTTNRLADASRGLQYFGARAGYLRLFPVPDRLLGVQPPPVDHCMCVSACSGALTEPRVRPWYTAAVSGDKSVLLLLDVSGSMTATDFCLMRRAVFVVLESLTPFDLVQVITFTDTARCFACMSDDDGACLPPVPATPENIAYFKKHICALEPSVRAPTNLTAAFSAAFDIFDTAHHFITCRRAILLFSDGRAAGDNEFSALVRQRNTAEIGARVLTFAVGSSALVMRELPCEHNGTFAKLSHDRGDIFEKLRSFFELFALDLNRSAVAWSPPYVDAAGAGLIMSALVTVFSGVSGANSDTLLGVVGYDVRIDALAEPIRALDLDDGESDWYAFLLLAKSLTIVRHPRASLEAFRASAGMPSLLAFENSSALIEALLVNESSGTLSTEVVRISDNSAMIRVTPVTYEWHRVGPFLSFVAAVGDAARFPRRQLQAVPEDAGALLSSVWVTDRALVHHSELTLLDGARAFLNQSAALAALWSSESQHDDVVHRFARSSCSGGLLRVVPGDGSITVLDDGKLDFEPVPPTATVSISPPLIGTIGRAAGVEIVSLQRVIGGVGVVGADMRRDAFETWFEALTDCKSHEQCLVFDGAGRMLFQRPKRVADARTTTFVGDVAPCVLRQLQRCGVFERRDVDDVYDGAVCTAWVARQSLAPGALSDCVVANATTSVDVLAGNLFLVRRLLASACDDDAIDDAAAPSCRRVRSCVDIATGGVCAGRAVVIAHRPHCVRNVASEARLELLRATMPDGGVCNYGVPVGTITGAVLGGALALALVLFIALHNR
jgi:hypothetical protein